MEFLGKNCRKGVEWSSICFVFSQCVVFLCKEMIRQRKRMPTAKSIDVEIIRHQVLIPVIEVQVRACPQNDQQSNENDYKWELIQLKMNAGKRSEKIYRLSNKNSDERNDFLRVIRQIIREDVRRMHVNVGQTIPSSSSTMIKTDQEHFVDDTKLSRSKQQHGLPPSLQPPTSSAISKFDSISQKNPRLSMMAKQSSISSRSSNRNENDDQHQNHQHQHQHQHHHHHHHHSHKVPCGFCGKEVSLKHQKQSKDHLIISSPKRNNNWKSSSTSPTNNVINKSHLQQDSSSTTSH
ncbi:Protein still life, isoform SIF type 1 [Sarcoptes scabiei]|uniref:Protein still life, isoform SIF type 1 n=1 Tax=Sarcoptes scabiei TaxID=52283 RepID=A0A834RCL5_SARSC|nr:Protein still life, isoform SIF type 1 [Sarcoptes scabiei]